MQKLVFSCWTLFEKLTGLLTDVGQSNSYRVLDTGSKVNEAKNGKATVEKQNNNVDTSSTEYRLPLVWIDLEMTG